MRGCPMQMENADNLNFETFLAEWTGEISEDHANSVELGRRFSHKLITQWLDLDPDSTAIDVVHCDGSGDGGIDIAYLDRGEDADSAESVSSHTWYLVQSKYGTAFQGRATLLQEGQKVIDTLDGRRTRLSSLAEGLLERLNNFRDSASERDRIVLVFATTNPLDDELREVLRDIRTIGRERLGALFDVESVSVGTIFQRLLEEAATPRERLKVSVVGDFVPAGADLLIGPISLTDLYDFLRAYRMQTDDLDQLYEKNVRRFLGSRGKVNKGIQATLKESPERFGLYNNGITIVVANYEKEEDGRLSLTEPYIVNGCQTTRTIWEVCHQKLEAGGTGENPARDEWRARAEQGVVIAKIVKVGESGEEMLQNITRYTNSQNAVREKDFLALTSDFRTWAAEMADRHGVFLEIQRGAWDSQKAYQRQHPTARQFTEHANAFDLIKVYGAGWLGQAGLAFGKNPPFLPNGSIFKRIVNNEDSIEPFGLDDLFAAYLVQKAADEQDFGRGARTTRRQTRFLFYMVLVELMKDLLTRIDIEPTPRNVTNGFLRVLGKAENDDAASVLLDAAMNVIDSYLTQGNENSVFEELALTNTFNGDMNAFLKWEQLGRSADSTPRLRSLLEITKMSLGQSFGRTKSPRATVLEALATGD